MIIFDRRVQMTQIRLHCGILLSFQTKKLASLSDPILLISYVDWLCPCLRLPCDGAKAKVMRAGYGVQVEVVKSGSGGLESANLLNSEK